MIAWFAGQKLTLFALGMLGAICFCLWLLWLRKYLEWGNVGTLDIKERVGLKIEFVKTAAQIVGGLFFILTILVAYWNYQVSQKSLEATPKKNEADLEQAKEKQVTELYVKAIGQLGSDKLPVILGGIYALERIARSSEKKDKGPILDVLTAYVRQNAPWPPEDPAVARKRRSWTKKGVEGWPWPDTDIQAVLTVLGRLGPARDKHGKHQQLVLSADLRSAALWEAHLEGADLFKAHLERAWLGEAHLEGARLEGAHLEGADLPKAHLEGARLEGAHLEGADLKTASGLTQAQIDQAYCDDETQLPEGLKCSPKKKSSP